MEDKKKQEEQDSNLKNTENTTGKKQKGSGIFTTDGKELPDIEGGYDFYEPGGSLGDNDLETR